MAFLLVGFVNFHRRHLAFQDRILVAPSLVADKRYIMIVRDISRHAHMLEKPSGTDILIRNTENIIDLLHWGCKGREGILLMQM